MIHIEKKTGMQWTAVRTRPRCEKVVDTYCQRHRIPCYLPLRRRAQRYQRRTVETFLPLFPGYVFVQIDNETRSVLLQSHKIVTVLRIDAVQERTLVAELGDVQLLERAALEAELVVQPEIVPGRPVRVRSGPLAGMSGIVQRRQQKTRVTVNVEILGQSVSVELDVGDVDVDAE